jgi:hypothetical protein
MVNTLRIVQLNCHKSKTATAEILKYSRDNNIHLIFLQEPYNAKIKNRNVYKIPDTVNLTTASIHNEQFLSAIICNNIKINNFELNPVFFPQFSNKYLSLIAIEVNKTQIFCLSVYLPPQMDFQPILPEINKIAEFARGRRLIICGDFNCRSNTWFDARNDSRCHILEEFLTAQNLIIENQPGNPPTFRSPNGESNIDLTLTSAQPPVHITNWRVSTNITSSDHNTIEMEVRLEFLQGNRKLQVETCLVLDVSSIGEDELAPAVTELASNLDQIDMNTTRQIDVVTHELYVGLGRILKQLGRKRRIYNHRPDWWNEEVDRYRKIYLAKKSLFYRNKITQYTDHLHAEMSAAKEKFKEKLNKARTRSWDRFVEQDLQKNPWGAAYKLATEKFRRKGVLHAFSSNGDITGDATSTMKYLINNLLPDDHPGDNTPDQHIIHQDYVASQPNDGPPLETTEAEVDALVAQIHNNKAPGHDKLKGSTIKRLQPYLSSLLTKIFNSCLKLCYFPKIWKIGDLVVILKDPQKNHSDISNYRPITLLPEHAKIFEKIVRRKLEENLNPLHSPHQFGFSKGKSSTDALHRLTSKITGSRSKYVATLFFDIKGAFDNLWWPGLIQHLRRRGLQPNLLALVKSYLTDRKVNFTRGDVSTGKTCTKGCPQGSVLGPTLWNLVLDSLLDSEWSHWTTPIAYADDLAVIVETNERTLFKEQMKWAVTKITDWAKSNKLTVSAAKTSFMVNKTPPRAHNRDINLKIDDTRIRQVKTQKYLGIMLDSRLLFESHATYINRKARTILMALRTKAVRHWHIDNEKSLLTIYKGAILPILSYASRVWIHRMSYVKINRQFLSTQGVFCRILTRAYQSVSTDAALVLAGLAPIDLELERINCHRELRQGRNAMFQGEVITGNTLLHPAHLDEYLRLKMEDIWQERWDQSEKGRTTYEFIPTVTAACPLLDRPLSTQKTQVVTGHGNFGAHLLRIGKDDTGHCPTCDVLDNPQHRILVCPLFAETRIRIRQTLRTWPPDLKQILTITDNSVFEQLTVTHPD